MLVKQYNNVRLAGVLFAFLFALSGCATTENHNLAEFESNDKGSLPEISFFYSWPSDALRNECRQFDESSVMNHCLINNISGYEYFDSLRRTKMFQKVKLADEQTEYQVEYATAWMHGENAADISKAAVAGATLLMVPVSMEKQIKAEVNVYWRGKVIEQLTYDLPHVSTLSLFHDPQAGNRNFTDTLTSHFLKDVQEKQIFTPQFLSKKLNSSDYETRLQAPEASGDFALAGKFIYNSPFLGASLRYHHKQFADDYIDVFVYPVKKASWEDSAAVIKQELAFIRKEIDIVKKEQAWLSAEFGEDIAFAWQYEGQDFQGFYFDGVIQRQDEEESYTSTYAFIKKDKVIKFRTTFPAQFSMAFVKHIMSEIEVPEESVFMAKIRLDAENKTL